MKSDKKPHCPYAEGEFLKLIDAADETGVSRRDLDRVLSLTGDIGAHKSMFPVCSIMLSHQERVQLKAHNVELYLSS